jgi:hypothetical protein
MTASVFHPPSYQVLAVWTTVVALIVAVYIALSDTPKCEECGAAIGTTLDCEKCETYRINRQAW